MEITFVGRTSISYRKPKGAKACLSRAGHLIRAPKEFSSGASNALDVNKEESIMKTVLGLAILLPALVIAGCGDAADDKRLNVDLISLNLNAPLYSDVYHLNGTPEDFTDDYIPTEQVEVTMLARPYSDVLTTVPGKAFGSVRMTEYSVVFGDDGSAGGADLDGDGKVDLKNFTAPMNMLIPAYNNATAYVLVVPVGPKSVPPISSYRAGGTATVKATLTFRGKEETSGYPVEVTQGLSVTISNFGDA